MSDFLKYLGLSDEDAELAKRLASPADMAAQGASSLGESAGRALGGLGAKLDARLGTTARGQRPKEIDPLMPQETTPRANLGLFETLGTAVPNVVAATAGNALPVSGPAMPGAVAAFPTPKQSFARMKDEAVFRDMMEAKGAKAVELPPVDPAADAIYKANATIPRGGGRPSPYDPGASSLGAVETNNEMGRLGSFADRMGWDDFRGVSDRADAAARATMPVATRDRRRLAFQTQIPLATPNPRARIPAEQSELERYLSGLFGPRAK